VTLQALNLIDNQWQPAQSGKFEVSVNPADGSAIGRYAASDAVEAEAAIACARRAFERPDWAQSPRLLGLRGVAP
jgi:acyl-CoA reductase-like NAD-dependent aldehyde dehydrogenase